MSLYCSLYTPIYVFVELKLNAKYAEKSSVADETAVSGVSSFAKYEPMKGGNSRMLLFDLPAGVVLFKTILGVYILTEAQALFASSYQRYLNFFKAVLKYRKRKAVQNLQSTLHSCEFIAYICRELDDKKYLVQINR
eukprot:scaffold1717_cov117-Cylindrotheca_fusiformis.AAC.1